MVSEFDSRVKRVRMTYHWGSATRRLLMGGWFVVVARKGAMIAPREELIGVAQPELRHEPLTAGRFIASQS